MNAAVGFLVGLMVGLRWRSTVRRIEELLFIRQCQGRFSLCLDCDLHNRCSRYYRHYKANTEGQRRVDFSKGAKRNNLKRLVGAS